MFVPAEGVCIGVCRVDLKRALKEPNGSVRFFLQRETVSNDTPGFRAELVYFGDLGEHGLHGIIDRINDMS